MKTINVSDDLHSKLKNMSDKSGMSIQEIITLIVEKGLDATMSSYELKVEDPNNLEKFKDEVFKFIKLKGKKEDDFIYSVKFDMFRKNPSMILTLKHDR